MATVLRRDETPIAAGTLKRLLAGHSFFRDWDDARLQAVSAYCRLLCPPPGVDVLCLEDLSPFSHFLLAGQIPLVAEQAVVRTLAAEDLDARFPFAALRPSRYRVLAGPVRCPG